MKRQIIISLTICLLSSFRAFATGLSETNQGIYLAVGAPFSTNEPIRFDMLLAYMPCCNTGNVELAIAPPAYGIRIKMVGPDGKEASKTPLGHSYGSKFDQWHKYNDARLGGICACGPYKGLLGGVLPSAKELFIMDESGIYTLEVQMQMFRTGACPDTNAATRNPIQFSPVAIKVEKPQ
jgi:hypothetical protein